jgi:hypothetical protein
MQRLRRAIAMSRQRALIAAVEERDMTALCA